MKQRVPRKVWVLFIVATGLILLLAVCVILFVSARLQQSLLTQAPQYDAPVLYNKSVEQVEKGDYGAAEQLLEQALRAQDDATYRSELAVVKYRLKKYPESVELYAKLIADGKDAAFAWNGTGNAYRDWADSEPASAAEHREKAIAAYNQAIILNSEYIAAYSNLALLYDDMNKQDLALKTLDAGIAATRSNDLVLTRQRIAQK
jgi:tetratricopeptide (TPR) repeat protein